MPGPPKSPTRGRTISVYLRHEHLQVLAAYAERPEDAIRLLITRAKTPAPSQHSALENSHPVQSLEEPVPRLHLCSCCQRIGVPSCLECQRAALLRAP